MKAIFGFSTLGGLVLFWLGTAWPATATLSIPITLDPPLLRAFLIRQAFPEPGPRAVLADPQNPCNRIELRDPEVGIAGQGLILTSRIHLRAGVLVQGRCRQPLDWEGTFRARWKPLLEPEDWRLHFQVLDSRLYERSEDEITLPRVSWDLIKGFVHPHLEKVTINLAPPVEQIKSLMPWLVREEDRDRIAKGLKTLRPGPVETGAEALIVPVLFEMEVPKSAVKVPGAPDYPVNRERVQALWALWDPFVVFQVLALIGQPLNQEERDRLLEILLSGRYRFSRALDRGGPLPSGLIRREMATAWEGLRPILRKYLVRESSPNLVSYLAFFSVMDAWKTLEGIGPAFGLEAGRDGLIRLARLLAPSQPDWEPRLSDEVNPGLRQILQLGPPIEAPGPYYDAQEIDLPEGYWPEPDGSPEGRERWLIRPAAGGEKGRNLSDLLPWVPSRKQIEPYIGRVRGVITEAVEQAMERRQVETERAEGFKKLVSATAWQESCWRQFTSSGGKLRYLTSSNGTSVGLMQINVRVWRGIYRPDGLRWNIRYNARAGTEILARYLRYGLARRGPSESPFDDNQLYPAVYAMYNGGPDQFDLFQQRAREDRFQRSDRLFKEKYQWVDEGLWEKIGLCLKGREI